MKTKKITGIILSVLMMVSGSLSVFAMSAAEGHYTMEDGDWEYVFYDGSVTDDRCSTVAIKAYNGSDKNVIVPDKFRDYTVAAIFDEVFMDNDTVESVNVPDSVTHIHRDNFEDCRLLKNVYLPETLDGMDERCFERCSAELEIVGTTDSYAFRYAQENGIRFKEYQNSDSSLYKYEFLSGDFKYTYYEDCGYWDGGWFVTDEEQDNVAVTAYVGTDKNVVVPSEIDGKTVCGIFDEVFMNNNGIESVRIPNTIKRIHRDNFENCSRLKEVYLTQSVERIDELCFLECENLSAVYGPKDSYVSDYFTDSQYNFVIADDSEIIEPDSPEDTDKPIVKAECGRTIPGQFADVTVSLENNKGFSNIGIEIGYDENIMSIVEIMPNDEVKANFTSAEELSANPFNISWDSIENNIFNGKLITIRFKINDNVSIGSYPITVDFYKGVDGQYTDGDDVNYDEKEQPLGLVYGSATLNVDDHIPGDVSGDYKINSRDAVMLLRYLAKWNMPDINTSALDTNGDGKVNNKDATLLLRYVAGWDVELK